MELNFFLVNNGEIILHDVGCPLLGIFILGLLLIASSNGH